MYNPKTGAFTSSTISLRTHGGSRRYEEKKASVAITPGMILQVDGDDKFLPHNVRGGFWDRAVAIENALQGPDLVNTKGNTIDDDYAIGDLTRAEYFNPGETINALLHAGENVDNGDYAISYGDGTVCKAASSFLADIQAASSNVSNTTTETAFSNGTVTIPANNLKAGDIIRVRGQGICPSTNSTDTLTIKLKIGSTVIVTTGAVDVANNDIFYFEATLVVRTIGASGTLVATGVVALGVEGTVTAKPFKLASTTIDTTAALTITVTATWSVASASNTVRQDVLVAELVRAGSTVAADGFKLIGRFDKAVDNSAGVTSTRVPVIVF